MAKWLVRRDLMGNLVGAPRFCPASNPIMREPGVLTIDELLALMLDQGESAEGGGERRTLRRGATVIGYVDVVEAGSTVGATARLQLRRAEPVPAADTDPATH